MKQARMILIDNCNECPFYSFQTVSMVLKHQDAGHYCQKYKRKIECDPRDNIAIFCNLMTFVP